MGNRRKLPNPENRIRSKTGICQKRGPDKGSFHDLLYKSSALSFTGKETQILRTLRSMQMTLLNTASGYIPSYTRTELTDTLHKAFGFRTDYEFITKSSMRTIIKDTKQIKAKTS